MIDEHFYYVIDDPSTGEVHILKTTELDEQAKRICGPPYLTLAAAEEAAEKERKRLAGESDEAE